MGVKGIDHWVIVAGDLERTLDFYARLGFTIAWEERPADFSIWKRVDHIPDGELWRTHERRRERLIAFARDRLKAQLKRRGAPPAVVSSLAPRRHPAMHAAVLLLFTAEFTADVCV